MTQPSHHTHQQGFVAILTVLLFTVLISVLTVGFLRVMTDQSDQVVQDDLSKGALAAAQSGAEDGKRALARCRSLTGAAQSACYTILTDSVTSGCPGIYGPASSLAADLNLTKVPGTDAIRVGDESLNQRTTCTIITLETDDVVGRATENLGVMVPLQANAAFDRLTMQWHRFAEDGQAAIPASGAVASKNPTKSNWRSGGISYPAMMRVQLLVFRPGQTLGALSGQAPTTFLVPSNVASAPLTLTASTRQLVHCDTASSYACTASIGLPAGYNPASGDRYFALVSSVYGSTNYRLTLQNGGSAVKFFDAEPSIDVTGASGDVFRRIETRVAYHADGFFTHNALEVGSTICKDYLVAVSATSSSGCSVSPATIPATTPGP
jgi:Tfp pilus assembly protein PilX